MSRCDTTSLTAQFLDSFIARSSVRSSISAGVNDRLAILPQTGLPFSGCLWFISDSPAIFGTNSGAIVKLNGTLVLLSSSCRRKEFLVAKQERVLQRQEAFDMIWRMSPRKSAHSLGMAGKLPSMESMPGAIQA